MRILLDEVTKTFGDVVANDHISLTINPGEIHCILGENGAGKSTLMNIIYGLHQPDAGRILVDDEPVVFESPRAAMERGIGMVHQHFMLIPVFTVAENVMLGDEPKTSARLLDYAAARRHVVAVSERFGFQLDPDALVSELPVGVQQRVEIVKALARDAQVLIFDEPTAVLTPQETDELIAILRQLSAEGKAIVFISHKLREVRAIADRISVIRHGRVVGEAPLGSTESELAAMMVGRSVSLTITKSPPRRDWRSSTVVSGLTVVGSDGAVAVDDISIAFRGGEITAIAGVEGNGQTEFVEALVGLRPVSSGSVTVDGAEVAGKAVKDILAAGVGFVPEDRKANGIIGSFTIEHNLVLDRLSGGPFTSGIAMHRAAIRENGEAAIAEFDIRAPGPTALAGTLSGGNQQKIVLARELARPLALFIASQPTRGLDVGSIEFVHARIVAERDAGAAVVIVSTELDEVYNLADRIVVMYRGEIVGVVPPETPRDVIGLMMAGIPAAEAVGSAR
ncbi:ABC transporter ATP-binding protein [Herbiconiux moechotypicola]|uniref:ABC transporter ATP-binding protein n=1 Tax=Herbiconiux moechotypicola TaxID=637393 RepID=A0ABN3DEM3_9MICO|nr:ABC transporter ATP-binding protein [Herbiconiux moechotypicola]MCS5729291.1 ABC transporter ATP-binding protein [Herbiconiux moechotypicola]